MSSKGQTFALPSYDAIPGAEHSQTLKQVLAVCQSQQERIVRLEETVAQLRDEIASLKGEKPRPQIKPSTLNKDTPEGEGQPRRDGGGDHGQQPKELEIHEIRILQPEQIPAGSVFKGYEDYLVQGLRITLHNTKYRRARYQTPTGETLLGELPVAVRGSHFDPELRSYILLQYYQQHVSQPLLLKQLWDFGVQLSSGQLSRLLTEGHESFHAEKAEMLRVGLAVSAYLHVDDTAARHQGQNGYCTHIGNELFAWFASTESKSRINFLELLRAGQTDYVIDAAARAYMHHQQLPQAQLRLFMEDRAWTDKAVWDAHLHTLGIAADRHLRIATEGALVASLLTHGVSPELVILSDDAGQFHVAGFLHALCWIHAERTIHTLLPFSDANRTAQAAVRDQIWRFYQELKAFKLTPGEETRRTLRERFDTIFTQHTGFQTLNLALKRIHANKQELLLVLERPDIPLHNNLSENDIRDYVKKRKISATTRSEAGRAARDTFLSLKKTCQKLGLSFWHYLQDRLTRSNHLPPLPLLIRTAAQAPS
jgi:transposase IS66 family protein